MSFGIGGGGFAGLAVEVTPNTYVAPTKFFPFNSESLGYKQDTIWRRPIRKNVDVLGGVPGNVHIEGELTLEAIPSTCVYFHKASRASLVKAGAGPYTYTFTPTPDATAGVTVSITVVRNGIVFGYVGCVLNNFKYSIDNGLLMATYNIIGSDEAVQSLPVAAFTSELPFGAGEYDIQVPTGTQVFDVDTFEFNVEDNAEPQYRLKNTGRGAQFIKYGERNATATVQKDFQTRAEYDAYKALTAQSIRMLASHNANEKIQLTMPSAIKDTYEVGLSAQGDLVRASCSYQSTYDFATDKSYELVFTSATNIT